MSSEGTGKCGLKRAQSSSSRERQNEYHWQWYRQNKGAVNACRRAAYKEKKRASIIHQHDGVDNGMYGNMTSMMGRIFS